MQDDQQIQLNGTVESVTYHNENSGFTGLELSTDTELVTVVGAMADVAPGEQLRVTGSWTVHASYGQQFHADACGCCRRRPPRFTGTCRPVRSKASARRRHGGWWMRSAKKRWK